MHTLIHCCVQILPRQVPVPMTFNRTELKALQVHTHTIPTPVVCLLLHACTPAHHQDKAVRDRAVARRRELVNRFNRKLKPLFRKLFRGATDAELAEHATAVGLLVALALSPIQSAYCPPHPHLPLEAHPLSSPQPQELYLWGIALVGSRALTIHGRKYLVPFADMFNYQPHDVSSRRHKGTHTKHVQRPLTLLAWNLSTGCSQGRVWRQLSQVPQAEHVQLPGPHRPCHPGWRPNL